MTSPILPEWAFDDEKDPISGQFNVVEPPDEVKRLGWKLGEKPNRQWWNWLHRQTFLCLEDLYGLSRSSTTVVTNSVGQRLFPVDDALITIEAIDLDNPQAFFKAVGVKRAGHPPEFNTHSIQKKTLHLELGAIDGTQPMSGGSNIIIRGSSSKIPQS